MKPEDTQDPPATNDRELLPRPIRIGIAALAGAVFPGLAGWIAFGFDNKFLLAWVLFTGAIAVCGALYAFIRWMWLKRG
jgi:hypothetical protein